MHRKKLKFFSLQKFLQTLGRRKGGGGGGYGAEK
jgi:hypothetical protein